MSDCHCLKYLHVHVMSVGIFCLHTEHVIEYEVPFPSDMELCHATSLGRCTPDGAGEKKPADSAATFVKEELD